MSDDDTIDAPIRELFIEELAEVEGGSGDPLRKIKDWLQTTHGLCEESPC